MSLQKNNAPTLGKVKAQLVDSKPSCSAASYHRVPVLSLHGTRMVDSKGEALTSADFFQGMKCIGEAGDLPEQFHTVGLLHCEHEADQRFIDEIALLGEKICRDRVLSDGEKHVATVIDRQGFDCPEQLSCDALAAVWNSCRDQLDHFGSIRKPGIYLFTDAWFDNRISYYSLGLLAQWTTPSCTYEMAIFPISKELTDGFALADTARQPRDKDFFTHFFGQENADFAAVFLRHSDVDLSVGHVPTVNEVRS